MSRYESGQHEPPYKVAVRIAEVLDLPVAYFYCDKDELAEVLLVAARLNDVSLRKLRVFAEELAGG